MINTWEAVQGVVFMVVIGLITRGTVTRSGKAEKIDTRVSREQQEAART